jgi:hypothetical protein
MRRFSALGGALAPVLAAVLAAPVAAAAWQDQPENPPAEAAPEEAPSLPLSDIRIDISDEELAGSAPAAATSTPTATPVPVARPSGPVAPPTSEEREQIRRTAVRGRLLFDLARAAQLTTRDMLSRISDPAAAGIAGWVAAPEGNGLTLVYYADGAEGPEAVYRAQVVGGRIATRDMFLPGSRPALTPTLARMARAREAVAELDRRPCPADAEFNVFVVPPATAEGPVEVYKLSPQLRAGHYPLGGHFLATVAPDGTVASVRDLALTCLDLEAPAAPAAGARPAPVGVTHLLDPLPTEIHVMLALWMNRPLVVATGEPERVWAVAQGRIGLIGDPQAQASGGR